MYWPGRATGVKWNARLPGRGITSWREDPIAASALQGFLVWLLQPHHFTRIGGNWRSSHLPSPSARGPNLKVSLAKKAMAWNWPIISSGAIYVSQLLCHATLLLYRVPDVIFMHDPSSSFVVSIRFHIYQQESASPALVRTIALLISRSLYSHPEQRNGPSPRAAAGWNLFGRLRWLYFVCE